MAFSIVLADLRKMFRLYIDRPVVVRPPVKAPADYTEADHRAWHIFSSFPPHPSLLSEADIRKWNTETGLERGEIYDRIALYLARRFHARELEFGFCDEIVNDLHGVIARAAENPSDLFWSVFLAFDSGEFYPNNDRSRDPVETYTRPLIGEVVDKHSCAYPDL